MIKKSIYKGYVDYEIMNNKEDEDIIYIENKGDGITVSFNFTRDKVIIYKGELQAFSFYLNMNEDYEPCKADNITNILMDRIDYEYKFVLDCIKADIEEKGFDMETIKECLKDTIKTSDYGTATETDFIEFMLNEIF